MRNAREIPAYFVPKIKCKNEKSLMSWRRMASLMPLAVRGGDGGMHWGDRLLARIREQNHWGCPGILSSIDLHSWASLSLSHAAYIDTNLCPLAPLSLCISLWPLSLSCTCTSCLPMLSLPPLRRAFTAYTHANYATSAIYLLPTHCYMIPRYSVWGIFSLFFFDVLNCNFWCVCVYIRGKHKVLRKL